MKKKGLVVLLAAILVFTLSLLTACADDIIKVTATFDSQGGSAIEKLTVDKGGKLTEPNTPTKDGFVFGGWYKEAACANQWIFAADIINESTTLYAKWTDINSIASITIKTPATKLTFDQGSEFKSEGLVIEAQKLDGTKKILSLGEYTVNSKAFKQNIIGSYTIVISLLSDPTKTTSYEAVVIAKRQVVAIAVNETSTQPTKFLIGDEFTSAGLVIEKTFADNTKELALMSELNIMNVALTHETSSLKIDVRLDSLTCSYNIQVLDPTKLAPTKISIRTPSIKTEFAKGDAFRSEGLTLEKTTAEFGSRKIPMAINEYSINADQFLNVKDGQYTIEIISTANSQIKTSYLVNVVDLSTQTVSSIRLKSNSSHQTEFYLTEAFNTNGLLVEKIMSGGAAITLISDEYTIQQTYDAMTPKEYTITITFNADTSKYTNYKVNVVAAPSVGKYFIEEKLGGANVTILIKALELKNDGKLYSYNQQTGALDTSGRLAEISRVNGKYIIRCEYNAYEYNVTAKTLSLRGEKFYQVSAGQKILEIDSLADFGVSFVAITDENGKIPQRLLDNLSALGALYEQAEKINLIDSKKVFDADTTIYLRPAKVDYTGKPFVGFFRAPKQNTLIELTFDGQFIVNNSAIGYSAEPNGNDYIFAVMGFQYEYNTLKKEMTALDLGVCKQLDLSLNAIVTLTQANGASFKEFIGKYAVEKGKPFDTILYSPYNIVKLTLENYVNTNITQNASFQIIAAEVENDLWHTYGDYALSYKFNSDKTVSQNCGLTATEGSFKILNIKANVVTLEMTFGSAIVNATISTNSNYTKILSILDGANKGKYCINDQNFYLNLPFIGKFTNSTVNKIINIYNDGTLYVSQSQTAEAFDLKLTAVTNGKYTLELLRNNISKIAIYDVATRVLTLDGIEYLGETYSGLAFVGKWMSKEMVLSIASDGKISFGIGENRFNGDVADIDLIAKTFKFTIENNLYICNYSTIGSLTVTNAQDVSKTFVSYDAKYKNEVFVNKGYYSPSSTVLSFDDVGNLFVNYVYIGHIIQIDGLTITLATDNIVAPTELVVLSADFNTITWRNTNYKFS